MDRARGVVGSHGQGSIVPTGTPSHIWGRINLEREIVRDTGDGSVVWSKPSFRQVSQKLVLLFCSLAVLDPRVGHIMDVLSPFISVLCHSGWLFHMESCPRLDVVHPGRAWSSSPACTWHCSWHYLILQATPLFPHGVTTVCLLASLLWWCLTVLSFSPALLRTQVFFAAYETPRIFLSPFISKASRRVSSFFLRVQLSQPYVATGHTSAFISPIFVCLY